MSSFWLNFVNTLLLAVVSLTLPPLFAWGLTLLHKHNLNTAWYEAVGRAGGVVWATMVANGTQITDKEGLTTAAFTGAEYLQKFMNQQIATRQLNLNDLAEIAAAEYTQKASNAPTTPGVVLQGGTVDPTVIGGSTATVQPEGTKV